MNDCLFCKIGEGSIPSDKVYESDTLFAINDINPQAPTHILIIPRIHQDTLLDVEEKDHALMGSVISVANNWQKKKESINLDSGSWSIAERVPDSRCSIFIFIFWAVEL